MNTQRGLEGVLLDEELTFSFIQFCELCDMSPAIVIEMVQEGVMEPLGAGPDDWAFQGLELARARRAVRLMQDLELNWAGTALVLDLLEELERVSHQVPDKRP